MMRSLLFVPGDSERKLLKAISSGADALILDLEDSVALSRKTEARSTVASFLTDTERAAGTPWLIVRINALDTGLSDDDLAAVISAAPDAILLPKAGSGADIQDLSARIGVHEAESGLEVDKIKIHALMTETALPVSEVSIACGFVSASHFADAFRRRFGISPSQARRGLAVADGR